MFASGTSLFTALGSEINGRVGLEWFEIQPGNGTLLQSGTLADPTLDILYPTIAADANGNVAIAFTQSSGSEFPSVAVSTRSGNDPPGTLGSPFVLVSGSSSYSCSQNPVGWGTYSTTIVDPSQSLVLWTYQEFGHSSAPGQWSTHWTSFSVKPQ